MATDIATAMKDDAPSGRSPQKTAAIAGLLGSATATLVGAVVHTFVPAFPFLPVAVAQTAVRSTPGGFDSLFIDLLGHWAMRLAVIGISLAFAASGLVLGLAIPPVARWLGGRAALAGAAIFLLPWAVTVAMYPTFPQNLTRPWFALASLPVFAASGALAGSTFRKLMAAPKPMMPNVTEDKGRRTFIRAATLGGVGIAIGLLDPSRFLYRRPDPGDQKLNLATVSPAATLAPAAGDEAFASIPNITPEITPLEDFYIVNEEIIRPDVDPKTWLLSVSGKVGSTIDLRYDELSALPAVERYQTLECISNKVGGDIMSTQRWTGVPLATILERAGGLQSDAVEVVFRSVSGYADSMPVEQAMDPQTLIAIGMGGQVLPRAHGYPARVLGVGTYGMKNPKWLTGIEAVDTPFDGFWESRGWSKEAIVRTQSRIDTPQSGENVNGNSVVIAGVAFAGDRGISKVEVSTDAGSTWQEAQLKTPLSPITWRLWRYEWEPSASGAVTLAVRATDGMGQVQTADLAEPYPSGSTGYDEVGVNVS